MKEAAQAIIDIKNKIDCYKKQLEVWEKELCIWNSIVDEEIRERVIYAEIIVKNENELSKYADEIEGSLMEMKNDSNGKIKSIEVRIMNREKDWKWKKSYL